MKINNFTNVTREELENHIQNIHAILIGYMLNNNLTEIRAYQPPQEYNDLSKIILSFFEEKDEKENPYFECRLYIKKD